MFQTIVSRPHQECIYWVSVVIMTSGVVRTENFKTGENQTRKRNIRRNRPAPSQIRARNPYRIDVYAKRRAVVLWAIVRSKRLSLVPGVLRGTRRFALQL